MISLVRRQNDVAQTKQNRGKIGQNVFVVLTFEQRLNNKKKNIDKYDKVSTLCFGSNQCS